MAIGIVTSSATNPPDTPSDSARPTRRIPGEAVSSRETAYVAGTVTSTLPLEVIWKLRTELDAARDATEYHPWP